MQDEEPHVRHSEFSSLQDSRFKDSEPQESRIIKGAIKRPLSIQQYDVPNKKLSLSAQPLPFPMELGLFQETEILDNKTKHIPINDVNFLQQQAAPSLVPSSSNIGGGNYNTLFHHPQANAHNEQQTINIYNTTIKNNIAILAPQQRQPDFAGVRSALESYYKRHLKIQLLSGKTLDFEKCYVNLAIVEATHQQEVDRDDIDSQLEYFNRMKSYENVMGTNIKSTIRIDELFNRRELRDGSQDIPKKILIQGRAGIGKTTLCKKLVHRFITGEWRDRFEAVLWIPLRQLKILKPQNIEDLVKAKFIPQFSNKNKALLAEDISTGIDLGGILFILDGLDEVVQDIQTNLVMQSFLNHLLKQTHVIITSRPSGVDYSILPALDLELETVGFDTTNIMEYVNNVLDEESATSVMRFINNTPILQSLANIPVQLDVICHTWKSLPKDIESITVTKLYQVMVDKLLCNDVTRIGKTYNGRLVSIQLMGGSNERQIRNMMPDEIEYLSYLAFDGIKHSRIEFDYNKLDEIVDELNCSRDQTNQDQLPLDLLEILNQTSFLHSVQDIDDAENDPTQRSYHFIHLTFQEYFASIWLSNHLQTDSFISSNSTTAQILLSRGEAIQFIQQNKYNPRCEIIWWMIAGQLEGDALESFFQLLQSPPRDLIGVQHQYLISGCYKESHFRLPDELVNQIQSEISQWYRFEMKKTENYSYGSSFDLRHAIPDDIFYKCVKEHGADEMQAVSPTERHLTSPTIEQLIQLLLHEDADVRMLAEETLRSESTVSESAITALITALHYYDPYVRQNAARALGKKSIMSESVVNALLIALKDQNPSVRRYAAESLGQQPSMSVSTSAAIVVALQDQDSIVRSAAIEALGNQSTMSDSTVTAIVNSLQDSDSSVRYTAVSVLSKRLIITESIITALITSLQDENPSIRRIAISTLGNQSITSGLSLTAIITALKDQDFYVRQEAIKALGKQCSMSDSKATALIPSDLRDRYSFVGGMAVKDPSEVHTMSETSIASFVSALEDEDSEVRVLAIDTLMEQQNLPRIPDSIITALNISLQDQNPNVRSGATRLLRRQTRAIESTTEALIALQNHDPVIRETATRILGNQSTLSESAVTALLNNLKDQNLRVRGGAIRSLGKQSIISESTLAEIISTLKDQDLTVRRVAINVLGRQSSTSKRLITELNAALQDHCPFQTGNVGQFNQQTIFKLILSQIIPIKMDDCPGAVRSISVTPKTTSTSEKNCSTRHNIETLYKNFLFEYSLKYHLTLSISGNRLQIYTGHGFEESEELTKEDLCELEAGFVAAQRSGGVKVDYSFS